jgi:hypothetical protein
MTVLRPSARARSDGVVEPDAEPIRERVDDVVGRVHADVIFT